MTKCGICGHSLIPSFTKQGFRILTCPNLKTRTSRLGVGKIEQMELWCDMQITDMSKQPIVRGNPQETEAIHASIRHQGLKDGFYRMVGKHMLEELQTSTFQIIPENDLMKQANLSLLLELPMLKLPMLFNGAIRLSRTIGLNPIRGIESISKGIGRESRKILDNIGIVFKRSSAYTWFAREHSLSKLSEEQKSQAWKQYAINQVIGKARQTGTPSKDELKRMRQAAQEKNGQRLLGDQLRK